MYASYDSVGVSSAQLPPYPQKLTISGPTRMSTMQLSGCSRISSLMNSFAKPSNRRLMQPGNQSTWTSSSSVLTRRSSTEPFMNVSALRPAP